MNNRPATVTLPTPDLRPGMVVRCHGHRFRLTEAIIDEAAALARFPKTCDYHRLQTRYGIDSAELAAFIEGERSLRAYRTEELDPKGAEGFIPASWAARWTIQGNHRALWAVEADSIPAT